MGIFDIFKSKTKTDANELANALLGQAETFALRKMAVDSKLSEGVLKLERMIVFFWVIELTCPSEKRLAVMQSIFNSFFHLMGATSDSGIIDQGTYNFLQTTIETRFAEYRKCWVEYVGSKVANPMPISLGTALNINLLGSDPKTAMISVVTSLPLSIEVVTLVPHMKKFFDGLEIT